MSMPKLIQILTAADFSKCKEFTQITSFLLVVEQIVPWSLETGIFPGVGFIFRKLLWENVFTFNDSKSIALSTSIYVRFSFALCSGTLLIELLGTLFSFVLE